MAEEADGLQERACMRSTARLLEVLLRGRPAPSASPYINYLPDKKSVILTVPKQDKEVKSYAAQGTGGTQIQFKFDGVLNDASQEEVYEAAAGDVLKRALDGYNGTIMCYGQTGAGKTYTMSGGRQSFKQRGIIPRLITQLFSEIKARPDQEFKISISYLEIYNEQLYDLLDITTQPHELTVLDGPTKPAAAGNAAAAAGGTVRVQGLHSVIVGDEAAAMKLLFDGETNRVIGEHQLNRESSRSHSIFQISLEMRQCGDADSMLLTSKLSCVDLAGSERVSKTRSEGLVLKEAGHINKSLSILEQVILALSEKGREHVPFRSCKLTHVLKDSLGGNCATVLLANVWNDASQTEETISTCRFAQRMMRVVCEVTPNVVEDNNAKARQLQRQVLELQQELALHDAMAGRQGVSYAPYTPQQRAMLAAQLDQFLDNEEPESIAPLELINLRHVREVLYCLRSRVKAREATALAEPGPAKASASAASPAQAHTSTSSALQGQQQRGGQYAKVVEQEPGSPTSAMAARLAAPASVGAATASDNTWQGPPTASLPGENQPSSSPASGQAAGLHGQRHATAPPPDRQVALTQFTSAGTGATKHSLLEENRSRFKAAKKRAKELGLSINAAKRDIDSLRDQIAQLKAGREAQGPESLQVLSSEELSALERIQAAKKQYKDQFGELQMVRSEVDYTQELCNTCAKELAMEFQQWYLDSYGAPLPAEGDVTGIAADDSTMTVLTPQPAAGALSAAGPVSLTGSTTSSNFRSHHALDCAAPAGLAAGRLAAGLPMPGKQAGMHTPGGQQQGPQRHGLLPSLAPQPDSEELSDPEARAFYAAQQAMLARTTGVAHRPGSVKKKVATAGPTFSNTNRADITAKVGSDVFVKPGAGTRPGQPSC